jgi:PKD repeat protein
MTSVTPGNFATWDFGDGVMGVVGDTVTHTYTTPGTYTVTMNEDNGATLVCTSTLTVQYNPASNCSYTYVQPSPNVNPFLYDFSASVASSAGTVMWDFGDNTGPVFGFNVQKGFSSPGTYYVCMTYMNGPDTCQYCSTIYVTTGSSNCQFIESVDTSNALLYTFISGPPIGINSNFIWDFGDGTTGSGIFITHQYAASGTYLVCMTEADPASGILCTVCRSINVAMGSGLNCNFTSTVNASNPNIIGFTAQAAINCTYFWNLGDGTTFFGNNVGHYYTNPGTYNVCLTVSNGVTSCTSCQMVTVSSPQVCQANFAKVAVGLNAYFFDQSVLPSNPAPVVLPLYDWSFGDGANSSSQYPQHTYATPGVYNVCLTVTSSSCVTTYCDTIYVDSTINNPSSCNAFFIFTQLSAYQMAGVNLSSGFNLTFAWDFGDGSPMSNQPYPQHFYTSTGSYNVCLNVADNSGCTSTYCDTLTVDSLGNITYRGLTGGFSLNVYSPNQLTGVNNIQTDIISGLYPNPASSELTVKLTQKFDRNVSYKIIGIDGKTITTGALSQLENRINISSIESGAYLLELTTSDGSRITKHFVKQ